MCFLIKYITRELFFSSSLSYSTVQSVQSIQYYVCLVVCIVPVHFSLVCSDCCRGASDPLALSCVVNSGL